MGSAPGPQTAFSAFVAAHQAELVRLGWALTGDRQLGEDLAQSALARLWPRWSQVAASGQPVAYTQRIMVNLFSSWRQRRRWRGEVVSAQPADRAVEDQTRRVAEYDALDHALAGLPPRQRAVIVLRFLVDLDVTQTAKRLGCSTGTVKSQTAKALRALRHIEELRQSEEAST
jgi:RNA polymerase sigma-70 factor (sigma-E family)